MAHPKLAHSIVALVAGLSLLCPSPVAAQEPRTLDQPGSAFLVDIARQLVADPTTYAPAGLLYASMRLDWISSQPFFQRGYVEDNARFTQNGLPHDVPVSYGQGNRQILKDAIVILPTSILNNTVARFVERGLAARFPEHRRLVKALSWVERVSFASYLSYRLSANHFRQWQKNQGMAAQLGY